MLLIKTAKGITYFDAHKNSKLSLSLHKLRLKSYKLRLSLYVLRLSLKFSPHYNKNPEHAAAHSGQSFN